MTPRKALFSLLCMSIIFPIYANQIIYQWTDDKGELHFSDQPMPGSKKRIITEVEAYTPEEKSKNETLTKSDTTVEPNQQPITYKSIEFSTPQDNETIRNASATVQANLSIVPDINENHLIQFYLDDKVAGKPQKELTYVYQDVYRGSHTLSASIQDQNGKTLLSTAKITIYMHPPKINLQSKSDINVINPKRRIIVTQKVS